MFGGVGIPELTAIFVITVVVFGPRKIAELGKSLGEAVIGFDRALTDSKKPPFGDAAAPLEYNDSSDASSIVRVSPLVSGKR